MIDVRPYETQFGQTEAHKLFIANRQQYINVLGEPPELVILDSLFKRPRRNKFKSNDTNIKKLIQGEGGIRLMNFLIN
jgi:hypothetical protein